MANLGLASAIVMALVLVLIVYALTRIRPWEGYEITPAEGSLPGRLLTWAWNSPVVWMLGFVLIAVVVGLLSLGLVGAGMLFSLPSGLGTSVSIGLFGALIAGFLFFGSYFSIRSRGAQSSVAAALSTILMGFLMLAAIALQLLGVL